MRRAGVACGAASLRESRHGVGFIGLGTMGLGMCDNLSRRSGLPIHVFDADASRGTSFKNVKQVARECSTIILCLPNTDVASSVLFGEEKSDPANSLIEWLQPGDTIVDCGTSHPIWTRNTHDILAQDRNIVLLDAPVSGMRARADTGELTVMVGGSEEAFHRVSPLLKAFGSTVVRMGASGCGQLAKAANNVLFNTSIASMSEMLPLVTRLGLDPSKFAHAASTGSGQSFGFDFFAPLVLNRKFDGPGYPMKAAFKDMATLKDMTEHEGIPFPSVSAGAMYTYEKALTELRTGDENKGAMVKVWEQVYGVTVRDSHNRAETGQESNLTLNRPV